MSQTTHTKYKWPPYATEWTPSKKIFCVRHWLHLTLALRLSFLLHKVWLYEGMYCKGNGKLARSV